METKLKTIRTACGLSRAELAEKTGVKPSAIRDYEQGHRSIDNAVVSSVRKLASALGVAIEDLLEEEI